MTKVRVNSCTQRSPRSCINLACIKNKESKPRAWTKLNQKIFLVGAFTSCMIASLPSPLFHPDSAQLRVHGMQRLQGRGKLWLSYINQQLCQSEFFFDRT